MRKIVFLTILFTVMFGATVPFQLQTHYYSLASPLKQFSSYEELRGFVEASSQTPYYWVPRDGANLLTLDSLESYKSTSETPDYSTTNIQVEGVCMHV